MLMVHLGLRLRVAEAPAKKRVWTRLHKILENAYFWPLSTPNFLCCLFNLVFMMNIINVGLQVSWVLDKLHSFSCFIASLLHY